MSEMRRDGTRRKLIDGAIETLRSRGIAGTTARAIASTADVDEALVFSYFGTVDGLVEAACRESTAERVAFYHERFRAVRSLRELLALGRELNTAERDAGNVAVLAQVLAGARQDPNLAAAARYSMDLWVAEIEKVLRRILASSPVSELAAPADLAPAVAAAFIGFELYEGIDPEAATRALDCLEKLSVLAEVLDDLGVVARLALRARLRHSNRIAGGPPG